MMTLPKCIHCGKSIPLCDVEIVFFQSPSEFQNRNGFMPMPEQVHRYSCPECLDIRAADPGGEDDWEADDADEWAAELVERRTGIERRQSVVSIYKRAWEITKVRISTEKTSWGRNELLVLMAEALEQAVSESE